MRKFSQSLTVLLISLLLSVGITTPAQALTYSNTKAFWSGISWDVQSYSIAGDLGWARVRVHWNNSVPNAVYAPTRNNASHVVFSLKGDNCKLLKGVRFNLSSIEGLDLDNTPLIKCKKGVWVNYRVSLKSPGFTYKQESWKVNARNSYTALGRLAIGQTEDWNNHGPNKWGGRKNKTL